jgi:alpha-N-arabinofuranosidase
MCQFRRNRIYENMKSCLQKITLILLPALLIGFINIGYLFALDSDNEIVVHCDREVGQINRKVFGINFLAHEPSLGYSHMKPYYGHANYGGGIWDPKGNKTVKDVIDLAINAGISIVRFPGGAKKYIWKNAVGKEREHFLFGIDEFLRTINEINADTVYTLSYFYDNEQDAANLVEYLNSPNNGSNPNGAIDWAAERAKNGHPSPYGVKYFEIGEEVWSGGLIGNKTKVLPEEYANRYLKYYKSMKAVDPSIKIGVVLKKYASRFTWNKKVLRIIKDNLDFGIIHAYPSPEGKNLDLIDPVEVYKVTLAIPALVFEPNFQQILNMLREKAGREIPLAITEYNALLPFRHDLGTALVNAEMLRMLMKPDNKILMANHWHFGNGWFGMIKSNEDFMSHDYQKPINYTKRPNYYVYELYNQHFGDILLDVDSGSDSYDVSTYDLFNKRVSKKIEKWAVMGNSLLSGKWKIKNIPGIHAEEKEGMLIVNFEDPKMFNYFHSVKFAEVEQNSYYRVSGYIKAEDLIDSMGGVSLEVTSQGGLIKNFSSSSTVRISGTTDWEYVEAIHKPRLLANSANVKVRRIGKKGPLKGKVYIKNVKLEKVVPDTYVPYLSINASKSSDGKKVYIMVVNMNMEKDITSVIELKDFIPSDIIDSWVLNGPSVTSSNKKNMYNVNVRHKKYVIKNNSFEFTFEPHSLTAIEIEKSDGFN